MGTALTPSAILQRRWGAPWLVAAGADAFWPQLAAFQTQLQTVKPRNVLLAEPDPVRFLAAFFGRRAASLPDLASQFPMGHAGMVAGRGTVPA